MNFLLEILPGHYAVCRLRPEAAIPDWAVGDVVSITRTATELSIVCQQQSVPDDVQAEGNWRCLRVAGKLDFSLVGVLANLTGLLADAGVSVFVFSTFDTDYLLVAKSDLDPALAALTDGGHRMSRVESGR